jgi:surface carbohydrate biosynthesis protein
MPGREAIVIAAASMRTMRPVEISCPALIIPVESQVREMDAKLLLACCAAERGYRVVIGSRAYVHFAIASLPRGIYIAKSMRGMSSLMFRLIRDLGHDIIAWEEEALVHPPPDVFYTLRLSPDTLPYVSALFAWGEENRIVLSGYPHMPSGLPMHVTGNPRGDMLRPELRAFFESEVQALRRQYGEFLLINTNFTDVNPYLPNLGLFVPSKDTSRPPRFGQAGKGMPRRFAEGLRVHKQAILDDFLAMIPALEQALPGVTLVLRPHPSEHHDVYHELARRCSRVHVAHRGNVLPWLMASRALVHNGCTTAVEGYALGVPSIAYLRTFNPEYDMDFQGLPNRLSQQCFSFDELTAALRAHLDGHGAPLVTAERDVLMNHYVAARSGPLAAERIMDVLDATLRRDGARAAVALPTRLRAALLTRLKAVATRLFMHRPGRNRADYHNHRFPRLGVDDVARRIEQLGRTLGRFGSVQVRERGEHLFEVFAADGAP